MSCPGGALVPPSAAGFRGAAGANASADADGGQRFGLAAGGGRHGGSMGSPRSGGPEKLHGVTVLIGVGWCLLVGVEWCWLVLVAWIWLICWDRDRTSRDTTTRLLG